MAKTTVAQVDLDYDIYLHNTLKTEAKIKAEIALKEKGSKS